MRPFWYAIQPWRDYIGVGDIALAYFTLAIAISHGAISATSPRAASHAVRRFLM